MSQRANPDLLLELKEYGAVGIESCFNCGNCTAICPLTSDEHPFPRNMIRLAQVGLDDRILQSTDPWQCYYCGECTDTCPRGAEPAETMMALRRWATAQYDRSGHAAKLYTSERAVWGAIARTALLTLLLFVVYHGLFLLAGNSQIITDLSQLENGVVPLNTFAPWPLIWLIVLLHFARLGYRLLRNTLHMKDRFLGKDHDPIPFSIYLAELRTFVTHFATQRRWRDCGDDASTQRWFKHLLLVSGYVIMLVLVVGLLWWFQTDEIFPLWHPQRWLGYYATVVLIYASGEALIGRWRKREQIHRFSHPTDWLFPAFILVGAVTGILVNAFRYFYWPLATYIIYVIHLMAMMAMLDTEVGIGKWTHLIYRPLALYLEAVKQRAAQAREQSTAAPAPAGTD